MPAARRGREAGWQGGDSGQEEGGGADPNQRGDAPRATAPAATHADSKPHQGESDALLDHADCVTGTSAEGNTDADLRKMRVSVAALRAAFGIGSSCSHPNARDDEDLIHGRIAHPTIESAHRADESR
jgi:hypothetical protein